MSDDAGRWDDLHRELTAAGIRATRDAPLSPFTTYRVGGPATVLVELVDAGQLHALAAIGAAAREASGIDILLIGRGSNLLVADGGVAALVVSVGDACAEIERTPTGLRAGGSAALPVVARRSVGWGLTGFEWAVGVPGSVGGAVRMNAGGHGSDIAGSLRAVRVVDLGTGKDEQMTRSQLDLSYRHSGLGDCQLVVWADFDLAPAAGHDGSEELAEIVAWRREHQPGGANAGSVFANPEGMSAGLLIDRAGLKGLRVGRAVVSDKHANFIQTEPGATADDVFRLICRVRDAVVAAGGPALRLENRLWGFTEQQRGLVGLA